MTQNHQWLGSALHPHPPWPEGTQFIQLKSFWSTPLPLHVWYSDGAPSLQHSTPPPWQHLSQLHHPLPSSSYPAKQTPLSSLTQILVHFTLPETKQWKTRAPCLWQKMMTTDACVDPQSSGHIYPNKHLDITCTSLHKASSVLNWARSPTRWPNAAHVHLLYNIWGNFGSDLLIMLAFFIFSFNVSLNFLRIWLLFPSPQVSKPPNLPCWTLSTFFFSSLIYNFWYFSVPIHSSEPDRDFWAQGRFCESCPTSVYDPTALWILASSDSSSHHPHPYCMKPPQNIFCDDEKSSTSSAAAELEPNYHHTEQSVTQKHHDW